MNRLVTAFSEGIVAFVATNIDDFLLLLLFFSLVDVNFRPRHIILGQYLGFTIIIIASLPGFLGGLVVPREFIGLLGLLPIGIGLLQLVNMQQKTTEVQTVTSNFQDSSPSNPIVSFLLSVFSPQIYKVAAVTVANGGDNISIYIPLFAGQNLATLGVILCLFLLMVGVWCVIAYLLTRQPNIANVLSRYGKIAVPFVLIGLGLFIMYDRGTFGLLRFGVNG